jgi:hypothetical protein
MPNFDDEIFATEGKYSRQITRLFNQLALEVAAIGSKVNAIHPDRVFSFDDYPITKKLADKLMQKMQAGVEVIIVNGVRSAWTLANNKNNELSRRVFGDNVGKLTQAQYRRYFSTNEPAREAFLKRKTDGLTISDRVWRYAQQFKTEIELGLDIGIRNGLSAQNMARDLKKYLKEPEKLFRRVRDQHGNLQLSKKAAAYHPGQGAYRSSHKNALRLAVTETNMAYRAADDIRWAQMDFVVGYEIRLSNNPNHCPMCATLAGRYPKSFHWAGWHPFCRCRKIPILKTLEEFQKETEAILAGERPDSYSVNAVNGLPVNFTDWLNTNSDRITRAASQPYWLRDNVGLLGSNSIDQAIKGAVIKGIKKFEKTAFVAFEPFSPVIINEVRKIKYEKDQQKLFQEVFNDPRFVALTDLGAKGSGLTKVHPLHKKGTNWLQTSGMAKDINNAGIDVAFLPEYDAVSSADAITKIKGKWMVVDFKYLVSNNYNTIGEELTKGFMQGGNVVVKLENADLGAFKKGIDQVRRNGVRLGNVKLINRLGKTIDIRKERLNSGRYINDIRGFL